MHACFAMGLVLLGREGRFLDAGGTVVSILRKKCLGRRILAGSVCLKWLHLQTLSIVQPVSEGFY